MSPASSPARLPHVDALRGLAALLVAWTHLSADLHPIAKPQTGAWNLFYLLPDWGNLGRVGVTLFFGISGFVIYGSLEKGGPHPGRRFAMARFFRLYPAYWLSLLYGALLLWPLAGQPVDWPMLWANATMFPSVFGQGRVRDLYWTLEVELIFYLLCWALYRSGWMRRAALLPGLIGALLVCWLCTHLHGQVESNQGYWVHQPRHLAIMFWGALMRQSYDETAGFRTGVSGNSKFWQLVVLTCLMLGVFAPGALVYLAHGFRVGRSSAFTPPPTSIAYVIALPVFWAWMARVRMGNHALLPWLGAISYSTYLFHPAASRLLLLAFPARFFSATPLWVWLFLALGCTVAISAAVYYAVELPAMRLGARLNRRHKAIS